MPGTQTAQFDEWFSSDQRELRKIAFALKRMDHSETLSVTALVNEAYLRLRSTSTESHSEVELRKRAARAMRNILADAARWRAAQVHGGALQFVDWDENLQPFAKNDRELLVLDDALSELAALEPSQANMVEWHFFGGMSWTEVAASLGVSLSKVERDWKFIRVWLADKLRAH